jgi:monoamine oxidase
MEWAMARIAGRPLAGKAAALERREANWSVVIIR